jgi:hypothetical protein
MRNVIGIQSMNSTDTISAPAPKIFSGSIRVAGSAGIPSTFYTSKTSFGDEMVFNGTNFGMWLSPSYWNVSYGPTGIEYPCEFISSKSNDTEVHCSTLPTSSPLFTNAATLSGFIFRVTVFGRSFTGNDTYLPPSHPFI